MTMLKPKTTQAIRISVILLAVLALFTGIVVFAAPSSQAQPADPPAAETGGRVITDRFYTTQESPYTLAYRATFIDKGIVDEIIVEHKGIDDPSLVTEVGVKIGSWRETLFATDYSSEQTVETTWIRDTGRLIIKLPTPLVVVPTWPEQHLEVRLTMRNEFKYEDVASGRIWVEMPGPTAADMTALQYLGNPENIRPVTVSRCTVEGTSFRITGYTNFQWVKDDPWRYLESFMVIVPQSNGYEESMLSADKGHYSIKARDWGEVSIHDVKADVVELEFPQDDGSAPQTKSWTLGSVSFRRAYERLKQTPFYPSLFELNGEFSPGASYDSSECDFRVLAVLADSDPLGPSPEDDNDYQMAWETRIDPDKLEPSKRPDQCKPGPVPSRRYDIHPRTGGLLVGEDGIPKEVTPAPTIYEGKNRGESGRQEPRELSDTEKERGSTAFATSSHNPQKPGEDPGQLRSETQLHYQHHGAEREDEFENIGPRTGWVYNALAYNREDNWLYAISQPRLGGAHSDLYRRETTAERKIYWDIVPAEDPCFPAGHLLQIHPVTGDVYDLGKVTGAGPEGYGFGGQYARHYPNDLWGGISVGFFDKNHTYWVANNSLSGTGVLYSVEINANPVTAKAWNEKAFDPTLKRRASGDLAGPELSEDNRYRGSAEDYAILENIKGNYAWGLVNSWTLRNNGTAYIERINLDTGEIDRFQVDGLRNEPFNERIDRWKIWGKAWSYPNGNLAFGTGSAGKDTTWVQIKVEEPDSAKPTFTLVSVADNAPESYNTDAASMELPGNKADLRLTKKYLGKGTGEEKGLFKWQLELINNGPGPASGAMVEDILKESFEEDYEWLDPELEAKIISVETNFEGGNIWDAYQHNIRVKFGRIPKDGRATITFQAPAPEVTDDGCFTNRAVVTGLDEDPDSDNNVATASNCDIYITKTVVDINGNGVVDGDDARIPVNTDDGSEVFGVQYDLVVTGAESGAPKPYTLRDMPQFSPGVEVVDAQVISAVAHGGVNENEVPIPPTVLPNFAFTGPPPAAGWEIISEKDKATIAQGQTHTYRIQVNYRLTNQLELNNSVCEVDTAAKGLINTATLVSGEYKDSDDACAPIETVTLAIDKLGMPAPASGAQPAPIKQGAEFTIYERKSNGERGAKVARRDVRESAKQHPARGYYVAGLKKDTFYYLEETKAPEGHHLLAEPVLFKLLSDDKGKLKVQFYNSAGNQIDSGDGLVGTFVQNEQQKNTATVAYIQVADVTQGQLPRTGKAGVGLWALAGAVLIGLGAFVARRRMV